MCISLIIRAYQELKDEIYENGGLSVESKVFDNEFFGYKKITVETALLDEAGKPILKKGKPVTIKGATDTEIVALQDNIDKYMEENILPYNQGAFVDMTKEKTGYEIPFTRLFYKFEIPASSDSIFDDIMKLDSEETILMKELFGHE